MHNFRAPGAPPADPMPPPAGGFAPRFPLASGGWGLRPQTPKSAPPLRISGHAPVLMCDNKPTTIVYKIEYYKIKNSAVYANLEVIPRSESVVVLIT